MEVLFALIGHVSYVIKVKKCFSSMRVFSLNTGASVLFCRNSRTKKRWISWRR